MTNDIFKFLKFCDLSSFTIANTWWIVCSVSLYCFSWSFRQSWGTFIFESCIPIPFTVISAKIFSLFNIRKNEFHGDALLYVYTASTNVWSSLWLHSLWSTCRLVLCDPITYLPFVNKRNSYTAQFAHCIFLKRYLVYITDRLVICPHEAFAASDSFWHSVQLDFKCTSSLTVLPCRSTEAFMWPVAVGISP